MRIVDLQPKTEPLKSMKLTKIGSIMTHEEYLMIKMN